MMVEVVNHELDSCDVLDIDIPVECFTEDGRFHHLNVTSGIVRECNGSNLALEKKYLGDKLHGRNLIEGRLCSCGH